MDCRRTLAVSISLMLLVALVAPSLALAKGPGGGGKPGGEVAPNNLSVPTIMVGGGFTGVTCGTPDAPSALVAPSGTPLTGYSLDPAASWFVQGEHPWQAQCYNADPDTVTAEADWGDNLTGDAKLKVGSPIRVELGLETPGSMDGFTVVKLEPDKLDRESAYGTAATLDESGAWVATPTTFTSVRVFDAGVTFSVFNVDAGTYVVPVGSNPTAEINATGRVVYGYNLRVTAPGTYRITFVTDGVTLTNADEGDESGTIISLDITVVGGGGGGGRR